MVLRLSLSFEVDPGGQKQDSVEPSRPTTSSRTSSEPKIKMVWGIIKDWVYPLLTSLSESDRGRPSHWWTSIF